jgi:hypothetical protein
MFKKASISILWMVFMTLIGFKLLLPSYTRVLLSYTKTNKLTSILFDFEPYMLNVQKPAVLKGVVNSLTGIVKSPNFLGV